MSVVALATLFGAPAAPAQGVAELFGRGKYAAARQACDKHLEADPDNPEALYYAGRLSMDGAGARVYFERLLAAHPGHALADDAQLALGELAFSGPYGRYQAARDLFAVLLRDHPGSPHAAHALLRIGQTYLMEGQQDSARVYFLKSGKRDPESASAPLADTGLALVDLATGNPDKAADRLAASRAWGAGPVRDELRRRLARRSGRDTEGPAAVERPRRIWIQVGAFGLETYAVNLLGRLRSHGLNAESVYAAARGLHLVFVGPYPGRPEARKAVDRIHALTDIRGWIVIRQ